MSKNYYLRNLHLYNGCEYGVCCDFDIDNKVYIKISNEHGLELISTIGRSGKYDISCIIGVDIV
jgi:hypothetical protein